MSMAACYYKILGTNTYEQSMQCISDSLDLVRLGGLKLLRCLGGLFEKPQKVFLASHSDPPLTSRD